MYDRLLLLKESLSSQCDAHSVLPELKTVENIYLRFGERLRPREGLRETLRRLLRGVKERRRGERL